MDPDDLDVTPFLHANSMLETKKTTYGKTGSGGGGICSCTNAGCGDFVRCLGSLGQCCSVFTRH